MSWIKVHDELFEHLIWQKPLCLKTFLYLIAHANWKYKLESHNGIDVQVKRGSIALSVRVLAEKVSASRQQMRDSIEWLKTNQMINQLNLRNKVSLFQIVNYEKWQGEEPTEEPTENQPRTNSSIRKKNIRIIDYIEPCGSTSEASTHILEKKVKNKTTVDKSVPARKISWPTLAEVEAYAIESHMPSSDGAYMFYHWEGNGYTNGGKPIKSWKGTFQSWRLANHLPSQKKKAGNGEDYEPINPVFTES